MKSIHFRQIKFVAALLVVASGTSSRANANAKSLNPEPQEPQADTTYVGPFVRTRMGDIRGVILTSRAGREYSGFLGVPYARPPVGPLRFQIPYEAVPWEGQNVYQALDHVCEGRPSGASNGAMWEPISNSKPFRWFVIGDDSRMTDDVGPRVNFWDQYGEHDLYQTPSGMVSDRNDFSDLVNYGYFKRQTAMRMTEQV